MCTCNHCLTYASLAPPACCDTHRGSLSDAPVSNALADRGGYSFAPMVLLALGASLALQRL